MLAAGVLVGVASPPPAAATPIEERSPRLLADIDTNAVGLRSTSMAVTSDAVYFDDRTGFGEGPDVRNQLLRHDRATGQTDVVVEQAELSGISVVGTAGALACFTAVTAEFGRKLWVDDHGTGDAQILMDMRRR